MSEFDILKFADDVSKIDNELGKVADFWVGVFWQRKPADYHTIDGHITEDLHVWICLLPCVPIHIIRATSAARSQ